MIPRLKLVGIVLNVPRYLVSIVDLDVVFKTVRLVF